MSKEIEITPMNTIGKDERGETYDFSIRDSKNFIYITRKKGSLSGNTYHKGKSATTNPKIFILLSGQIKLAYRNIKVKEYKLIEIKEPSIIQISPYTTHSVEAITDFSILECNSIADIQNDRFREEVIMN